MFFLLSKILDVFLAPITWAMVCFAVAVPWRRPRRPLRAWRRQRIAGVLGFVLLFGFASRPVANALTYHLERATRSTIRPDVTYDAVVLLGGISDEHVVAEMHQPAYNDNVERLVATHRLLADGRARFAIISGAPEDPGLAAYSEARALAQQLVDWGIDPARILLEERARNTYENAVYSKAVAEAHGLKSVVIVTSAFHMRRAEECFVAAHFPVDTFMVDFRVPTERHFSSEWLMPRASYLYQSSAMLRELFGFWIYRLRGYASPSG